MNIKKSIYLDHLWFFQLGFVIPIYKSCIYLLDLYINISIFIALM